MPSKLNLPNNIILQKILKQHLYYDKKSKDPYINRIKPKFKLAGNCILSDYFFHLPTTRKGACKQSCTIALYLSDWENVASEFESQLRNACYCDLTKYEIVSHVGLVEKIKDRNNGFRYVSRLCDLKYKKLLKLEKNLHKNPHISRETKDNVEKGLSKGVDSLLSKLDLG